MAHKFIIILCSAVLAIGTKTILARNNQIGPNSPQLPPLETILLEPIEVENISLWVPLGKAGPFVNRSCRPQLDCSYSFVLPASVEHTKTKDCPEAIAAMLAEYTSFYHEQNLPLTIFNGWQWEYSHSLCQLESVTYDLPKRGGCWENSWEAILTQSQGSINFKWIGISASGKLIDKSCDNNRKNNIEVKTFSSVRTRNGYPKKQLL